MKKVFYFVMAGFVAAGVLTSCNSSKDMMAQMQYQQWLMSQQQNNQQQMNNNQQQMNNNQQSNYNSLGESIAKSPAQEYAEAADATTMRAWASYNGFPDDNLEAIAAATARGELSNMIATLAKSSLENFADRMSKEGLSNEQLTRKKQRIEQVQTKIASVSENLITGSKIVRSNRYGQKNGTHTAYVCVELDPQIIANKLKKEAEVMEIFNENEEMKAAFMSKKFDESMQDEFEKLREEKQKVNL